MMAKCRGDGREPPQRVQRAGVAVLWCWACDAFEAPPSTTPGASLPPLGAPALPPREALQGILGYENHPTYVYLARSQARNWPYPASRRGRVLGVRQDTLGLALALRSQEERGEGVGNLFL